MAAEPGISQQIQLAIKMLNSSNRMEKLSACRELSKAENRGVEPVWFALMKKNEDGDKDVRREVAVGLGIVSNKGEVKTVTTLCGMSDDREWAVREAAIRALVQVDCGLKSAPGWKPAENRVKAVIVRGLLDPVEKVRSAAAEALSHAVEKGDEIVFEVLVSGARDMMTVMKGTSVPSTPLKSSRSAGQPTSSKTFASSSSNGSSANVSSSTSRPKTPGEERVEAFWSRIGQAQDMEGVLIRSKPAHPPMPPEAPLQNAEALEGKVAFFGQSKRGSVPMFYDCAWRAKKAGAIGVVFVTEGNAERMASEEYHAPEGSQNEEDTAMGWGLRLDYPVAFVDPQYAGFLSERAYVSIFPEKSMRKALLGDKSAAVRTAALQTICDIAVCDDVRLVETLTEMLADSDRTVRHKCVEAFSNDDNVKAGNRNAVAGVALQTSHADPLVREAAIQALCSVSRKEKEEGGGTLQPASSAAPNPVAIGALKERLKDSEGIVKKHAVDGLIQLAMEGGSVTQDEISIIKTFIDGMNDLDPLVVTACSKALARLSEEEGAVANAFSWMVDSRLNVRKEAVDALGLARKGNLVARAMLIKKLDDIDPPVRAAAVCGLSKIAPDGDEEVADILIKAMEDPATAVRLQAIDGVERMVSVEQCPFIVKGCEAMIWKMGDADAFVRQRVSEAVLKVAKGRADVVEKLQILLSHKDHKIRKSALQTMSELIEPGDTRTMEAVFACIDDTNAEVQKCALHIFQGQSNVAREKGSLPASAGEKLIASTKNEDPLVATVAIEALPLVIPTGDRDTIMALAKCLKHESSGVREASARVMGEIAAPGDERAISCLMPLLESNMGYVRLAALQSLVKLGANGDERMVKAATSRLKDREVYVRREAVHALQRVAIQGDQEAVDALIKCLEDQDDRIRYSGMAGLGTIAKPGDKKAIASLFLRFGVEGRAGRKLLVEKALSELIVQSDFESIAQLLTTFDDPDEGVKRAGVAAILRIVPQGDSKVLALILETKFRHEDRKVRAVATEALQSLSVPGDAKVITGMLGSLTDHHPQVRKNGAEALATITPKGHVEVISALSNVLGDSMADVRKAAMQSLVVITDKNNATVIQALCAKLKSPEWHVRAAATDAISKLCDIGDAATVEALSNLLQDGDWFVREAALISLGKMVKPCPCKISEEVECACAHVGAVLGVVDDGSAKVRKAAIETLQKVGTRKDKRINQACLGRIKDADIHVRSAAEQALKRFS